MAYHVGVVLPGDAATLAAEEIKRQLEELTEDEQFASLSINPDVRPQAVVTGPALDPADPASQPQGIHRFDVWANQPPNDEEREARERVAQGFTLTPVVPATHPLEAPTFAMFIRGTFVNRLAQAAFSTIDKTYDLAGEPDPDGPITLDTLEISTATGALVTEIKGAVARRPGGREAPFSLVVTDTLEPTSTEGVVATTDVQIDIDRTFLRRVGAALLGLGVLSGMSGVFSFLTPVFAALAGIAIFGESAVEGLVSDRAEPLLDETLPPSVGASLALAFPIEAPSDLPRMELIHDYAKVTVGGGVVGSGAIRLQPREPKASIKGRRTKGLREPGIAEFVLRCETDDLEAAVDAQNQPISPTFAWEADPPAVAVTPNRAVTTVRVDASQVAPGSSVSADVRVTAADTDGLSATARAKLTVHVVPDPDEVELPDETEDRFPNVEMR